MCWPVNGAVTGFLPQVGQVQNPQWLEDSYSRAMHLLDRRLRVVWGL